MIWLDAASSIKELRHSFSRNQTFLIRRIQIRTTTWHHLQSEQKRWKSFMNSELENYIFTWTDGQSLDMITNIRIIHRPAKKPAAGKIWKNWQTRCKSRETCSVSMTSTVIIISQQKALMKIMHADLQTEPYRHIRDGLAGSSLTCAQRRHHIM